MISENTVKLQRQEGHSVGDGLCGTHSPSWHRSPLMPRGQWQRPDTGSQSAPFLHAHAKEQFRPKVPSGQAVGVRDMRDGLQDTLDRLDTGQTVHSGHTQQTGHRGQIG